MIRRDDPRFACIDAAAFKSKNLYNAALYEIRQAFIHQGVYLNYQQIHQRMQSNEAYRALPAKVAQQVLKQLEHDWTAFFEARDAYHEDPSKFTGRPRLPKYKDKAKGRNLLTYTLQALWGGQSRKGIQGVIRPSGLAVTIQTRQQAVHQVRIIPRNSYYVVEVVYSQEPVPAPVDPAFCAAIDVGVTNLAAITSNREGFIPRLVNGRTLKAINQWYNKRRKKVIRQKPASLIWTRSQPISLMMRRNTALAGRDLDGETVCIAREMGGSSVPMSTALTTSYANVSLMLSKQRD